MAGTIALQRFPMFGHIMAGNETPKGRRGGGVTRITIHSSSIQLHIRVVITIDEARITTAPELAGVDLPGGMQEFVKTTPS
jgi:hypothetical protein